MTAYHVPVSSIPLLQDPPFVLWLVLIALGLGRRCLKLLNMKDTSTTLERGIVAAGLGFGLLQYLPFGLGMAGVLTPTNVWIGIGILSVLALPDVVGVVRAARRELSRFRDNKTPRFLIAGALVLAVPLLAALISAVSPPSDPDGLFYHLTGPKRWLQLGELSYLPTLVHTNSFLGVNMLYTLAMAVWSDTAAKLIHYVFGLLSLLTVFALGKRLKSDVLGFAAAALWMIGLYAIPTLDASRLFSWAYVDLALTAYSVGAVLCWLLWSRTGERGWLIAGALTAGFALTTKLTGVFVAALLALVVLIDGMRQRRGVSAALGSAVLFGVIALLPAVPWFARTWTLTGSPVYLMFPKIFPTRDWSADAGAAFTEFFKYYVWGTGYRSLGWSLELRKAVRAGAMLATLLAAGVFVWRVKNWEHRFIGGVFAALVLVCVSSTGLYVRYLVPFLPLALLLALLPAEPLLRTKPLLQAGLVAFLGLNALLYLRGAFPSVKDTALAATGRISRQEFLQRLYGATELWTYANEVVPRDARILLAAGRPSYYIEPYCFLTEALYQERIRLNTWENFLADVRRDNLKYAIVAEGTGPTSPIGPDYAPLVNEMPFAHRLVAEKGRLLKKVGPDSLYELPSL